ncbi:MAG: valine--tRNA ligase [Chloroflexi bacterium]|nr:valine--tRNA ligase [Chloroflexota bacterium]
MTGSTPEMRAAEERWRASWDEQGIYEYDPSRGRAETFVVDTPPPTVSGSLHIGHCMSYTHTDLMVRYRRMRGDNVFYPMGWDDNGLATERRVQNVLNVRCDPSIPYDPDLSLEPGGEGGAVAISRRNFIEACDLIVGEDEKKFKGGGRGRAARGPDDVGRGLPDGGRAGRGRGPGAGRHVPPDPFRGAGG